VNFSSTSLFSTTGAKGLSAAAGCCAAPAAATPGVGPGGAMRKRGGCDSAGRDMIEARSKRRLGYQNGYLKAEVGKVMR
jgi:hypothetical protein